MPITTYPNLFAAAQDRELLESNEWLHIDESQWEANPLQAPVYCFPEDEMEELAQLDQAEECISGSLVPSAYAQRPMCTLCDVGTLDGVIFNLAKFQPRYTPEQLLHALEHYLEYDAFYEPSNVTLRLHLWAGQAAARDLYRLKERKAALSEALGHPPGGLWLQSNRPQPIGDFLADHPLRANLHQPAALDAACAAVQLGDINALYALAAEAYPNDAPPTVPDVLYLGCFEATVNPQE